MAKIGMDLKHPLKVSEAVQSEILLRRSPETPFHESCFTVGRFRREDHENPVKQHFQLQVLLEPGVSQEKREDRISPDDHFPVLSDQLCFLFCFAGFKLQTSLFGVSKIS